MSKNQIKVAVVQMQSGPERSTNLIVAEQLIRVAVGDHGATIIALPELFDGIGPSPDNKDAATWRKQFAAVEGESQATATLLTSLAAELNVFLYAGSVYYRHSNSSPVTNTTWIYGPEGRLSSFYDKLHLARLRGADHWHGEEGVSAGNSISHWHMNVPGLSQPCSAGMSTCYDLRFPELYRTLCQLEEVVMLFIPSAFYVAYGSKHWEVLLRARAIENLSYVIAPNQCGRGGDGNQHYGHSVIINPYGEVLANAESESEAVISATIDIDLVQEARRNLPTRQRQRLITDAQLLPSPEEESGDSA